MPLRQLSGATIAIMSDLDSVGTYELLEKLKEG